MNRLLFWVLTLFELGFILLAGGAFLVFWLVSACASMALFVAFTRFREVRLINL